MSLNYLRLLSERSPALRAEVCTHGNRFSDPRAKLYTHQERSPEPRAEVYMPHITGCAGLRDGLITPMRGPLGTAHSRFSVKSEKLSAICEIVDCCFLCTFAVEKVQLQ